MDINDLFNIITESDPSGGRKLKVTTSSSDGSGVLTNSDAIFGRRVKVDLEGSGFIASLTDAAAPPYSIINDGATGVLKTLAPGTNITFSDNGDTITINNAGSTYEIWGYVTDYASLPLGVSASDPQIGDLVGVNTTTGVYILGTRRLKGLYKRSAMTGVAATDYGTSPFIDFPANIDTDVTKFNDGVDPTKQMEFDISGFTTGTIRTKIFQNTVGGTIAELTDIPTGAALTRVDDTNVTLTLGGSASTALLNAASLTLGWSGQLSGARGGTGVDNTGKTITLGGNLTTAGAFSSTFTMTNTTNVTFPTSGTLATTADLPVNPYIKGGNAFGGDSIIGLTDNFALSVYTNNLERIKVNGDGTVGIGIPTATGRRLDVKQGTATLSFGELVDNPGYSAIYHNQASPSGLNYAMYFHSGSTYIRNDSSIGMSIGTTTKIYITSSVVDIRNNLFMNANTIFGGDNVAAGNLTLSSTSNPTKGNIILAPDATGAVLIGGATATGRRLDIKQDSATISLGSIAGDVNFCGVYFNASTPSGSNYTIYANQSFTSLNNPSAAGAFFFQVGASTKQIFDATNTRYAVGYKVGVNHGISTGGVAAANFLSVSIPTTNDALADSLFAASATTQKVLVLQAKAGQTANMLEVQDSSGVVGVSILGSQINTIIGGDTSGGNITISSTSHATKGRINFGSAGTTYYDEANLNLTLADGANIVVNTTTGTKIGTSATQKIGFYGATPVIQSTGWSTSNVTTDKVLDANSVTLDELADIVGTLIETLKTRGDLGA